MTTSKMRGAVFANIGDLATERDVLVRQNEAILEVQACAIRGTDLHVSPDPPVASLRSGSPRGVAKVAPPALCTSEVSGVLR